LGRWRWWSKLVQWLISEIETLFTALLAPIVEVFSATDNDYFNTVDSALKAALTEFRGTQTVSDATLNDVDESLFGPLFLLLFGVVTSLIIVSVLFSAYVFLFAVIASVLATILVGVLWTQAFAQSEALPSGEVPEFPISADPGNTTGFLSDFLFDTQPSPCRDALSLIGFLIGVSAWFVLLYVVGTHAEPSGMGAAPGAILFSLFALSFAFIGSVNPDPEIRTLFTILGLVMAGLAFISIFVLLGKPMWFLWPYGTVAGILLAGGFVLSRAGAEVFC
jgi:ABC-type multidrug transport system fused ATPase/permease subunit